MLLHDDAMRILDECGGNLTRAARQAGVSRNKWVWRFGKPRRPGAAMAPERTVVFSDIHAPYHDAEALRIALEYAQALRPHRVVLLGDAMDCYAVSHWRKDPTRARFPAEVDGAQAVLRQIASALPEAKRVYVEGNHEARVRDYLWGRASELYGLEALTVPELLRLEAMGYEWVSNSARLEEGREPYSIGKLYLLHGHEVRVTGSAVNIPRLYWQRCHLNVLVGHHHQAQEHIVKRLDGKHCGAWSSGCLCRLSAEYMPVTNWVHGLTVIDHDPDTGRFSVQNKKIIEGEVR